MSNRLSGMKSIAALLILTVPLSGCDVFDVLRTLAGPPEVRTVVVTECPPLEAPPPAVTDALATTLDDPESREWIDGLGKHYDKLATCEGNAP